MHSQKLFHAVWAAGCALALLGAPPAQALDCQPPACAAGESADGGVPDGHFESPAAAPTTVPAAAAVTKAEAADEPGAAIFNPFAGAQQERQAVPLSLLARLLRGDYALLLVVAALLLAAGFAVFGYLRQRRPS
jgi:hypothetical protein